MEAIYIIRSFAELLYLTSISVSNFYVELTKNLFYFNNLEKIYMRIGLVLRHAGRNLMQSHFADIFESGEYICSL